jgi:hypothetical protein
VRQNGAVIENSKKRVAIVPEKGGFIAKLLTGALLAHFSLINPCQKKLYGIHLFSGE